MFGRTRGWWHRREGGRTASAVEDRRIRGRLTVDADLLAYRVIDPSRPPMRAKARDVSAIGVRLEVEAFVPQGTTLRLTVPDADGEADLSVLACVVRVENGEAGYTLGCTFTEELDGPTMEQLGAKRLEGRLPDCQRVWERVEVAGRVTFERASRPGLGYHGELINLSPGGFGMVSGEKIDGGEVLSVEIHCEGKPSLSILACAAYLHARSDGDWHVGASFIRELTPRELGGLG